MNHPHLVYDILSFGCDKSYGIFYGTEQHRAALHSADDGLNHSLGYDKNSRYPSFFAGQSCTDTVPCLA
jgi:hypothetical protein